MTKLQVSCPLQTCEIAVAPGPQIYVASTLSNWERILFVCQQLEQCGITITYRWCDWKQKTMEVAQKWDPTIAEDELKGVWDANCILAVMPGERGSHFEMGAAYVLHKPIVICDDTDGSARPVAFHKLPGIERYDNLPQSIDRAVELARAHHLVQTCQSKFII